MIGYEKSDVTFYESMFFRLSSGIYQFIACASKMSKLITVIKAVLGIFCKVTDRFRETTENLVMCISIVRGQVICWLRP